MELEKATLSRLTSPDAVRQCWDLGLRADVFEDPHNARIYQFVIDYWLDSSMRSAPTERVITTEFPGFVSVDNDESLTWLVGKLQDRYRANQVQEVLRAAAQMSVEDPEGALAEMYNSSHRIRETVLPRQDRVVVHETIESRRDRYLQRSHEVIGGATLGLREVDEHTGGVLPGEVAIVAAYTKTGKSFMLVNAAVEAAKQGWVPYIATLEQNIPEFEDRIDAFYSGVGYGDLTHGRLSPEALRQLYEAQDRMRDENHLIHLERPGRGDRTVVNLVNRARQVGANYLVIDQLSWMDAKSRHRDRRDRYEELIYDLKEEVSRASAGEIPCFMAVQYNRQAVSTKGETGGLHNIANSADIEQTVDIAYGLHRTEEMRANNAMVLKTLGSRRGDIRNWLLGWYLDEETRIFVRDEFDGDEGGGEE
ncbi:RecA-like DNA recombinase [Gordonia phage Stormageddon]|uniref:DnaB-like dsDNA helicase n=1 Tax=Gordonia phage Stormageddon TaxID=2656541 RepID=A0A649VRW4_9CAUD|nr:RecA-like DNA recombinase [Gordonia phage Stormageddon]QGJ94934.1 DnaB-like dsDNA helicase [Gordonia phage Stormageddon]